jgi:hypothetical protein
LPNVNSISIINGIPVGGTGNVSTIDQLIAVGVPISANVVIGAGTNQIGNVTITASANVVLANSTNLIGNVNISNAGTVNVSGSVGVNAGNNNIGAFMLQDALSNNRVLVQAFHTSDNQTLSNSVFGLNTGGVSQLVNPVGNIDRQRGTGQDTQPATGISTGVATSAMQYRVTVSANIAAGNSSVTPSSMGNTIGSVPWSIAVGSVLWVDPGLANSEYVIVSAANSTAFNATFTKNHNTTPVSIVGFTYNQGRDAAGENDGATGAGTSVAAEYEYNAGDPSGGNYDRSRNVTGKGIVTQTITANGSQGNSILTLTSVTGLQPGMKVLLSNSGNFSPSNSTSFEAVNIALNYLPGSTTVPLASNIANPTVVYNNMTYDVFSALGPQANGFTAFGVGVDAEALWDPVTGRYFLHKMAPGANGVVAVSSDGIKPTYRWCITAATPVATPQDVFQIKGSSTTTVRIKSISLYGFSTAANSTYVILVRRTSVGTGIGNTVFNPFTPGKHDINDPAPTANVVFLSNSNPSTAGASAGALDIGILPTGPTSQTPLTFNYARGADKALILRGNSDIIAVNLNGATLPAGFTITMTVETEEDNS